MITQQPDERITERICIKKDKLLEFSRQKSTHTKGILAKPFTVTFTATLSIILQQIGKISY